MALPVKDADRRALVLQKLYDVRHTQGWTRLPLEANNTQEEQIVEFNICDQLRQNGLIEFRSYYSHVGDAKITNRRGRCNRRNKTSLHSDFYRPTRFRFWISVRTNWPREHTGYSYQCG
jgi:hypothetical protein